MTLLVTAVVFSATLYGFVAVIDPWDMLPLSPALPRVPISTNARFSFPALAKTLRFDAVVIGTSTARLLRPSYLDPLLDVHLVNLSMNSATAWEQSRLLTLYLRWHPSPKLVILDIDAAWCKPNVTPERAARDFPDWMYDGSSYDGYRKIFNLYAVQEAVNQLAVMVGLKKQQYGLDGYTNFLPPDIDYDARRVDAIFRAWGPPSDRPANDTLLVFETNVLLKKDLERIPALTRKLLFFPPIVAAQQGEKGNELARQWSSCKAAVLETASSVPNLTVVDFMLKNDVTRDRSHYWDPLHYRVAIANQLMTALGQILSGEAQSTKLYQVLRGT